MKKLEDYIISIPDFPEPGIINENTKFAFCQNRPYVYIASGNTLYVYNHQEEIARRRHQSVGVRTCYVYAAARFHAGKADIKEVVDILLDTNEKADPKDYTQNGITANIGFPTYASHYMEYMNSADAERYRPRIKAALNRAVEFFDNFPNELFGEYTSHWVSELVREQTYGSSFSRRELWK